MSGATGAGQPDGESRPARSAEGVRRIDLISLLVGFGAFALATALGRDAGLIEAIVAPPTIVRACFVGAAAPDRRFS